ncbi:hypothetical protein BD413DRAFT_610375 [Trametes elegans]|nr:hypothetical protein BD413DRAFT_610375 [Trametes elegans]
MHPFGGTPICPRCSKAVYAAEQIMGPGRKLYHKARTNPCLACKSCGKRLDSLNLVEHDEEPYCKNCHVKLFGTRDLRQANLPHRDDILGSPPTSPVRTAFGLNNRATSPPPVPTHTTSNDANGTSRANGGGPPLPARRHVTGGASLDRGASPPPTLLKPTRTLSPGREQQQRSRPASLLQATEQMQALRDVPEDAEGIPDHWTRDGAAPSVTPTHVGRGAGGLPRTIPLVPGTAAAAAAATQPRAEETAVPAPDAPADRGRRFVPPPLAPSMTGTRYGAALGGAVPLSPTKTGAGGRQWGGGTPRCGRCGQAVYFAEQVKAVGKTWHKGCLRCTECGHTLDSGRLAEKEGDPFCHRCYAKRFGPQGNGYALLGKPGG